MIEKIKEYLENNKKIQIAFALLFISTTMILSQLSDNISEIKLENLQLISSNALVVFGMIVLLSVLIYAIVDLFFDKSDHDKLSMELNAKLGLVNEMMSHKGLQSIVTNDIIETIEKESDEIIMILDNLYLDLSPDFVDSFQNSDKTSFGEYFQTVHSNMKNKKQYTYYIKYDNNTHKAIDFHMKSHFNILNRSHNNIKEPRFILIPSNEYNFFSDIYIYKSNNNLLKKAYEWLPSLTKDSTLFYLQFDPKQTEKLDHILTTNKQKYGITLGSSLNPNEEYIVNESTINIIEKESTKIQIITDDLTDDIIGGIFYEAVKENLSENTEYIYYVPDNKIIYQMISKFRESHSINNKVTFNCIPDNIFFFFNTVYIYNESKAFEYIPSSNMYFKYDKKQLDKLLFNIKSIELKLEKLNSEKVKNND